MDRLTPVSAVPLHEMATSTSTMTRKWNGLSLYLVYILVLSSVYDTRSSEYYERIQNGQMNWTSAAVDCSEIRGSLAKISDIDQLCDAQTELDAKEYWTALKKENGTYYWGNVSGSNQPVNHLNLPAALLDNAQPGNCYVISNATMKLKSKDCNSVVEGSLCSYQDSQDSSTPRLEMYTHECILYKLSNCMKDRSFSQEADLPQKWSCKIVSGMYIGNCQVESKSIDCCKDYCKYSRTYSVDSGKPGLSVKVRKVPKALPQNVEIVFNTSDKVTITHRAFNDSERIVLVSMLQAKNQESVLKMNNTETLVSSVIGVVLRPPLTKSIPNLVILHFSHPKVLQQDVIRKCVFWKEHLLTSNGSWSSDGCALLDTSSLKRTVCGCNHLTNFAVLMQYTPVQLQIPREHEVPLSIITYIGCALSLTGEVLVVFIYVVFMNVRAEGIQIRINLATGLFLAQVVFLSGINATDNRAACVLVAALLHYFFLASFGWMLLEGLFLYIMVVEVFAGAVRLLYLYLFAWGFPVIPVAISLVVGLKDGEGLKYYTNKHFCWLSFSKHLSWFFVGPVVLIITVNFVILLAVLREIRNLQEPNPSKAKAFKKCLKGCAILFPLLGLTWVFGLLAISDAGLVFQYIFAILNSTQGTLIFLLHVLRNSEVRGSFHHTLMKWRFNRHLVRVRECFPQNISRNKEKDNPGTASRNDIQFGEQITSQL